MRREKVFTLPHSFLEECFGVGLSFSLVGLPEGAKVVGIETSLISRCFLVIVEHESFDEVPIGELAPHIHGALRVCETTAAIRAAVKECIETESPALKRMLGGPLCR